MHTCVHGSVGGGGEGVSTQPLSIIDSLLYVLTLEDNRGDSGLLPVGLEPGREGRQFHFIWRGYPPCVIISSPLIALVVQCC